MIMLNLYIEQMEKSYEHEYISSWVEGKTYSSGPAS
jgi:hypothetical protein